jgi:hypothetical protein
MELCPEITLAMENLKESPSLAIEEKENFIARWSKRKFLVNLYRTGECC